MLRLVKCDENEVLSHYEWRNEKEECVAQITLYPEGLVEFSQFGTDPIEVGIEGIGEATRQVTCSDDKGAMNWG